MDLNEHLIRHPAATFFVRVDSTLMKADGVNPGDLLVVDRSVEATEGRLVVAVLNGEFTVRRFHTVDYVPDHADFQIWGVVTYVICAR
jgi:DNA polymerase V